MTEDDFIDYLGHSELATSVSRFPTVVAIETETDFPHGLTVNVTGRPPVLLASDGGPAGR